MSQSTAYPSLSPISKTSVVALPPTGTISNVINLPFGMYSDTNSPLYSVNFVSGAVDEVAFVYNMLGGAVLDIELTEKQVYSAYESAVLEYAYIINLYQARNILPNVLGNTTGTFNHDGTLLSGQLSSSLSGTHVGLKFPRFDLAQAMKVAQSFGTHARVGGDITEYSASIAITEGRQDYNLQNIVMANTGSEYYSQIQGNKVLITKVYYKSPRANWQFYGYYGGLNVYGNLSTYGQYADDSTFEIVPVWQNKLQAMAYEDALYTRGAHFTYELMNNNIRLIPVPTGLGTYPPNIWFKFIIPGASDAWDEDAGFSIGTNGVNNLNTVPIGNIPFENINAIGKNFIRKYALAICKSILSQIRGKFATIPIPGESVTLNAERLASEAKEEMEKLKEDLMKILDETTYVKLAATTSEIVDLTENILKRVPALIYVG